MKIFLNLSNQNVATVLKKHSHEMDLFDLIFFSNLVT